MSWLKYFRSNRPTNTAQTAKERLQVVIAHEHAFRDAPDYLPKLREEILQVIRKYVQVAENQVSMQVEREGNLEVLELNITLPEPELDQAL